MANRRSGRRADLRWTLGRSSLQSVPGAGTTVLASNILSAGTGSQTIMRTRGHLVAWLDGTLVAGDVVSCAIGFLVVPGGSAAVVISSPITDSQAPYFWFEAFTFAAEDTAAPLTDGLKMFRAEIDSKAMRILRPDREVQCVAEAFDIVQTSIVNFQVEARFLIGD